MRCPLTETEKLLIISEYQNSSLNIKQLAKKYKRIVGTIRTLLVQYGISIINKRACKIKVGDKIAYWTVVGNIIKRKTKCGSNLSCVMCRCICGIEKIIIVSSLISGKSRSCGCSQVYPHKHGQSRTKLYHLWRGMRSRCEDKNHSSYNHYGAKGIAVCDEWHNFIKFKEWADQKGYKEGLSIDRMDVRKGYESDNCEWVSRSENTRRINFCRDLLIDKLIAQNLKLKQQIIELEIQLKECKSIHAIDGQ